MGLMWESFVCLVQYYPCLGVATLQNDADSPMGTQPIHVEMTAFAAYPESLICSGQLIFVSADKSIGYPVLGSIADKGSVHAQIILFDFQYSRE